MQTICGHARAMQAPSKFARKQDVAKLRGAIDLQRRDEPHSLFQQTCPEFSNVFYARLCAREEHFVGRSRVRPPVWPGGVRGPFSPLWLLLPCSQKRRASVLLTQTYRHNKSPTARALGDSLASSRRTNSRLGQILHSCIIRWRWSSKFSN